MKDHFGYMGKILWVDLSTKEITEENPSEEIYRKYLGGYGLGVYYIYKNIKPNSDPLGPNNILGFCPGLFTGTIAPITGRYMVCGKSPLTGKGKTISGEQSSGGWGDSNSGGYFGPAIRRAGYDAIFIKGASVSPVYLYIDENIKELRDAKDLWTKDTTDTEILLKEKYGKGVNVASIGRAGENVSLIAGIVNDGGRIAARSGLGAVMGSKKLKALCLKGRSRIKLKDPERAKVLSNEYRKTIKRNAEFKYVMPFLKHASKFSKMMRIFKIPMVSNDFLQAQILHGFGTSFSASISSENGDTPIKNHKGIGYIDYPQNVARSFNGPNFIPYRKEVYGCYGCPLRCGAILSIPELGLEETHRPEYETIAAFGGLILNPDVNILLQLNEYLNREGMDTISAGGIIAFVLELVEKGILTKSDFKCKEFPDGFLPEWNKSDYILPLLRMIVNREGIGDILADGTKEAGKKLRKNGSLIEYALTANGQELPMHDGRYMKSLLLAYLTDPTPGRHTALSIDFAHIGPINRFINGLKFPNSKNLKQKGIHQAKIAKFYQSFNSIGFCHFSMWIGSYPLWELFKSINDWDITPDEFLEIGYRIQTLRQMFNAREGAIRHEIPKRALGMPPLEKGPLRGVSVDVEEMIQGYYETMGFHNDGVPLEQTLKDLNLEFCLKDLKNCQGRPNRLEIEPVESEIQKQSNLLEKNKSIEYKFHFTINITCLIEYRNINEEIILSFNSLPKISEILKKLKIHYGVNAFSSSGIRKNLIAVFINGVRQSNDQFKNSVNEDDIFTIVNPITGG